jgi:hypothetical protein
MVEALAKACVKFIIKNSHAGNILPVFTSSLFLDEPELQTWCADQIMKDTGAVLRSPEFLGLSPEAMGILLRAPVVSVDEVKIFTAVYAFNNNCLFKTYWIFSN